MSDAWRVELTPAARRDLRRLDPQVRRRVLDALDGLSAQPPRGNIRRLTGIEAEWRLRVGDWRVRFTREQAAHTAYVSAARSKRTRASTAAALLVAPSMRSDAARPIERRCCLATTRSRGRSRARSAAT